MKGEEQGARHAVIPMCSVHIRKPCLIGANARFATLHDGRSQVPDLRLAPSARLIHTLDAGTRCFSPPGGRDVQRQASCTRSFAALVTHTGVEKRSVTSWTIRLFKTRRRLLKLTAQDLHVSSPVSRASHADSHFHRTNGRARGACSATPAFDVLQQLHVRPVSRVPYGAP